MRQRLSTIALAFVLTVAGLAPGVPAAHAGVLDLLRPKLATFPLCHDPKVLGRIVKRFNAAERDTWRRGLVMVDIGHVRERRVLDDPRPDELDARLIPRRYCTARAVLNEVGSHRRPKRTVFYLIEGGQGFAGTRRNVEFCIDGLDPWRVYDGHCEVLRRPN